jgi:hypothetical protein
MKQWFLSFLLLLSTAKLSAQLEVHADLGMLADDNIDNNYLRISDRITTPSLSLHYSLSDDTQEANFFYSGILNYYSLNTVRTFQLHSLGGDYTRAFGDESQSALEASFSLSTRTDRTEFAIYDYSQFFGVVSFKHFFTETSLGRLSYNFHSMGFHQLSDFDFTEHIITSKYTQQLSTGTTIILNIDLGGKVYTNSSNSTASTGMKARGKSSMNEWMPSVIQTIGSVRVGQSIWEGTGVSAFVQYQWNLRKQTRYISSEYGLISDDDVFDDHYGYEGLMLQGMLTQKLPFNAQVRFIISRQDRLYVNFPVLDLSGNQISGQRNDTRTTSTLNLTKPFESLGIELTLSYDYIVNASNDPVYQYTNSAFAIGLSLPF